MGILDIFKREPVRVTEDEQATALRTQQRQLLSSWFTNTSANVAYKELAIQMAIDLLANAIVKSKFETYNEGKPQRGDTWYRLNYEPNVNENAAVFWNRVVDQMVHNEDGALVIQLKDGQLLCADSYVINEYATRPNTYSGITVGTMSFDAVWSEEFVWHFKLNNGKVTKLINAVYADYGKLLGSAVKNYNRNTAMKLMLSIGTTFDQYKTKNVVDADGEVVLHDDGTPVTEYDQALDELYKNRFAGIFEEGDSVTPLEDGLTLGNLTKQSNGASASATQTTRDVSALFNDVVNMVADAFGIPRGLMKGDTADAGQITDNFIALPVNSLVEQISSEINRKMYGYKNISQRTYLRIRTDGIRNYDITKLATSAELMSRIGVMSVNEVLELLDREPIDEDWADEHIISKNYALLEDALKGGENSEDEQVNDPAPGEANSGESSTDSGDDGSEN